MMKVETASRAETRSRRKSPKASSFPPPTIERWLEPGKAGSRLEVEDFLSMHFANLSALFHRKVTRRYLEPFDIGLPEWRTLTILARHAPISTRALRSISEMDKGQMSRALVVLAERGLVSRDSDASHMVRQTITLTDAGRALYRKIMPDARRGQAMLLLSLTAGERKALHSALIKLKAVVADIPEDPDKD